LEVVGKMNCGRLKENLKFSLMSYRGKTDNVIPLLARSYNTLRLRFGRFW
jgi:hypothetical protein